MLTLNVSLYTLTCHCNNNVIGKKYPISSNVTMPTTSFSRTLCHRKFVTTGSMSIFFTQMMSYTMRYYVIYSCVSSLPYQFSTFEDVGS